MIAKLEIKDFDSYQGNQSIKQIQLKKKEAMYGKRAADPYPKRVSRDKTALCAFSK
ncbi:hypothetical protein NitYY0814_C1844 [Nitratiruptor sp. YY08-14]|nr:hypothetical protein NitYY0814_C1844 [Nitratiruptor sp. YY08-14]